MYSYDRTALDLGVEAERFQRLVEDIRKRTREARRIALQAQKAAEDRIKHDEWRESVRGFDRILDELDGM